MNETASVVESACAILEDLAPVQFKSDADDVPIAGGVKDDVSVCVLIEGEEEGVKVIDVVGRAEDSVFVDHVSESEEVDNAADALFEVKVTSSVSGVQNFGNKQDSRSAGYAGSAARTSA